MAPTCISSGLGCTASELCVLHTWQSIHAQPHKRACMKKSPPHACAQVWCNASKRRVLAQLGLPAADYELLTRDPNEVGASYFLTFACFNLPAIHMIPADLHESIQVQLHVVSWGACLRAPAPFKAYASIFNLHAHGCICTRFVQFGPTSMHARRRSCTL